MWQIRIEQLSVFAEIMDLMSITIIFGLYVTVTSHSSLKCCLLSSQSFSEFLSGVTITVRTTKVCHNLS